MDLKKSSITADILIILSDCKVHTLQEIADEVEVHKNTVAKHIQSLSYRYPINTFCGGINRGGVCLDKGYVHQGKVLTNDELASGMLVVINNNIGISKDSLFTTMANLLGFTRKGNNIIYKLSDSLDQLIKLKQVKESDDELFLV